tara:strand:- start:444 stop:929 length:486 start_codon:yes stop_codon:yes gene_type:complete
MKNHKKYLFLFFSTFTAFFLPLSGSAFAACGDNITGGAGTLGDPYQIDDANELNAVSNCLGSDYSGVYFQVTSNIDLDVSPYNTGSGWTPIGTGTGTTTRFYGTFDGNDMTISNLYISNSAVTYQGLFGSSVGTISDLGLEDIDITVNGTAHICIRRWISR